MAVNKTAIAAGISFVVGLAGGGLSAFFYCKNFYKTKADQEIQDMAEYYARMNKKEGKKHDRPEDKKEGNDEIREDVKEEKDAGIQANYEEISDIYKNKTEADHTAYNDFFDSNSSKRTSNKKSTSRKKKKDVIRVVDDSYWENTPKGYDTKFMIYYEADNVLYDEETEQVAENVDILIGSPDNLDTDTPEEPIYILNDNLKVLYHITVEHMSYAEQGLDD